MISSNQCSNRLKNLLHLTSAWVGGLFPVADSYIVIPREMLGVSQVKVPRRDWAKYHRTPGAVRLLGYGYKSLYGLAYPGAACYEMLGPSVLGGLEGVQDERGKPLQSRQCC